MMAIYFNITFLTYVMVILVGPPSQPTNIRFLHPQNNTSYQLLWTAPNDTYNCVSYYLINTTTSELLLHTTDTSVLITRPADDPANTTYTVSIAAVDTGNRTGQRSDPLCFVFQGLPMNFSVSICFVSHPLYISS